METHKNIAASINQLIEINNDRIEGYKKAIELLPEGDHYGLRGIFEDYRDQSIQFNADLKPLVATLGDTPTDDTRTTGKMFRAWMELKSTVAPHTVQAILESCERGEDEFRKVYKDVLADGDLNADLRVIAQSQLEIESAAHDHIKDLRDAKIEDR